MAVALGDLDGDSDPDAFVANTSGQGNTIWFNDGSGNFSDSGQILGSSDSMDVALGDIDGDSDLDAFVANWSGESNKVWLNDGSGNFSDSGQSFGSSDSHGVALGDLDGDNDLEVVVANDWGQGNTVWINFGFPNLAYSQSMGSSDSLAVALCDLNGDSDPDAFVANFNVGNTVWLNLAPAYFFDSGQSLGSSNSIDVALGDLDVDGDQDAFIANLGEGNRIWLNDGSGNFSDSGQSLGTSYSMAVALGDLDGDNDLDAFVANLYEGNKVWINVSPSPNYPPVANDDFYFIIGDATLEIGAPGVLENDTDLEGDALVAQSPTDPTNGSVTFNSDGSFSYTPNPGYRGEDSFTYKASDGTGESNTATVTITVNETIIESSVKKIDLQFVGQLPSTDYTIYQFGTSIVGIPISGLQNESAQGLRFVSGSGLQCDEISDYVSPDSVAPGHMRVAVNLPDDWIAQEDDYSFFIFNFSYDDGSKIYYGTYLVENQNYKGKLK
jgi:hypothetical protein